MKPALAAALLSLSLAGCSWFSRKPPATPAVPAAAAPVLSPPALSVEPVAAARAACSNYDALVRESPFPRDAIIRGIDAGTASVIFAVDGTTITVLSVTSTAPAFGDAATDAARKLRCTVDRPARFAIAFEWRTVR